MPLRPLCIRILVSLANDYWSTKATLEAIGHRKSFGLNFDPSHMVWRDYVGFLDDFSELIFHVDC